ncbi:MAG: tRNA (N(6)-L-threonylcarbamoyladenosine(37)-C(2))-methylthiotransferase [Thermoplasmata archaeon]|nr:tRNA (N(6)-L-threonylcarbamoyladenosine(37)-C(2))-methylthiotransferase [Thermoplasmata archaeon]
MKVLVEAYGCSMNRGEAEEFIDSLLGLGNELARDMEDAEVFAIFTCGVIETTERKMLKRIKEFAKTPEKRLFVCGCLPNINPEKIRKAAPRALVFGPAEHMKAKEHFCHPELEAKDVKRNQSIGILPIATGCLGSCAYCATKNARGGLRSKTPVIILKRMQKLVAGGAAEIQICAQDTAIYGRDLDLDLDMLVKTLETIEGDYMMRIGMMNPSGAIANRDMIIRAFESPRVFKFFHLPVQSGSDTILEKMGRRHTICDFIALIGALREKFPGLALSTDIIIGFPGETQEDFEKSIDLMKQIRPDIINITRFSSRPDTEAQAMNPKIPGWVIKERSKIISALRFDITRMNYEDIRGKYVKALATEHRMPGSTLLRTVEYRPVIIEGEHELGKWYDVRITGKTKIHLNGKLESVK